jgi:hypothetical protein
MTEFIGYAAAACVVLTFCCRDMLWLRVCAICSNVLFIGYANLAGLQPILVLHALLLPINLIQALRIVRERRSRVSHFATARSASISHVRTAQHRRIAGPHIFGL